MKKYISPVLLLLCICLGQLKVTAQQQLPKQIPVAPVKVVNFQQLADYEKSNPPKKKRRFIEQGEDREKNFKFIPKPVPANAPLYNVPVSHATEQKALVNSPVASASFNGVMDNGTLIPPDIRGAVGPNYVLETTNQQFNIYTKTGTLTSTLSITTFFQPTGGSGYFDPHCVYDANNGRFVICMDGNYSNGDGGIFVAVSQTSDPTGSWYVYSFDGIGNKTDFLDYPLLGFNNNWVVVTGNDFIGSSSPVYGKIYVMNRASLYSGTLGTVSTFTDNNAFSLAPAQTYDATQNTEYLVQDWNGNSGGSGYMQICTITGTASAPVFTAGSTIGVTQPWSETSVGAKQSGSTNTIESGDTRAGNAVFVNGSLWFCHTAFLPASSPTYSGVDWWQVNPATLTVQQFGRVYDGTGSMFYYYPSINVNANNDAFLGYCQSSSTSYASAGYSFHAGTDAVNTMQSGLVYKAGVASYYKTYGGGRNRWGDYTASAVDPTDNSFWNFSEWASTSNNWGTVIAHVPASSTTTCNVAGGLNTTAITTTTATFNWTAVSSATSYNIQYRVVGTTTWSTGTSTSTSFNAGGLTIGTNYEWQLQTVCASGSSAFSASSTFSTTAACGAVSGLAAGSIANTSAALSWTAVSGATGYNLQWKPATGTTFTTVSGLTTASYSLTALTACTGYQFQVQSVCPAGSGAYSAATSFTTIGCTVSYCASTATNTTREYIKNVKLGTINNTSTDGPGYVNYTSISTSLAGGTSNTITLTPGFVGSSTTEYYTVYIDYNHNGVFTDAGETVVKVSSRNAVSKAFTVPTTALNGNTRMRIQMQRSAYQTNPCATYTYGEVQDFTVNITGNAQGPVIAPDVPQEAVPANVVTDNLSQIKLYPNPAQDKITVEFLAQNQGNGNVIVYDLSGQRILVKETSVVAGMNTYSLATNALNDGVYIMEIESNGCIKHQQFVIAK